MHATGVSVVSVSPVYTPSTVSKSEPSVVTVTGEVDVAVKLYQAVLPLSLPEHANGSPASMLAKTVLLLSV